MRRLMLRLADWYSGFTPDSILPFLEQSQFWPVDRLSELQTNYLRKLLRHAGEHVPYYRALFRAIGFEPSGVLRTSDIQSLPILNKADIMVDPLAFLSDIAPRPKVWLRTTGTTAQPLRFVRTRCAESHKIASRIRFRRWYGIERSSPLLNVGGIADHRSSVIDSIEHALHFSLTNKVGVYSSDLEAGGCGKAVALIEKYHLDAIMGYPTGITALARYVSCYQPLRHRPVAVFTNSETLTPVMRRVIRDGFGVEPRADYVATEGTVAHECPAGGLHVDMETAFVEIVAPPSDSDGSLGEVVVTYLHTYDFPLIRYRLGDLARWRDGPCACGRGLVMLDRLVGRLADGIRLPDGRVFTAANINMRIAHYPFAQRIGQYQIAQTDATHVELRLLDVPETDATTEQQFRDQLDGLFEGVTIDVRRMPVLPREPNGKMRPVIGMKSDSSTTDDMLEGA